MLKICNLLSARYLQYPAIFIARFGTPARNSRISALLTTCVAFLFTATLYLTIAYNNQYYVTSYAAGDYVRVVPAKHTFKKNCTFQNGSIVDLDLLSASSGLINGSRINRFIHRTWKTRDVPQKWQESVKTCGESNPDYGYCLWTDAELKELITAEYPWFLSTFTGYTYPIQRVDASRYFILYRYGGIYLDLDLSCRWNFDNILANCSSSENKVDVILAETDPTGVTNAFMGAKQGSSFMQRLVLGLIDADRWYVVPYPTIIFSTGPMYVTRTYWRYDGQGSSPSSAPKPSLSEASAESHAVGGASENFCVAPMEFYKRIYFRHLIGSSWHEWDGQIVLFLNRWKRCLLCFGLGAVLLFATLQVVVCIVRRRQKLRLKHCSRDGGKLPRYVKHPNRL